VEGHSCQQTADLVGELLSYGGRGLGAAPGGKVAFEPLPTVW
jgi:hypothetical protein